MFVVQNVLAFWGSVDPLMAIVEHEVGIMLPQSPHGKAPHPKHANGRCWRQIRYAVRRHRQQLLKRYMSWLILILPHSNLCYLQNLMQTAEEKTHEPGKSNTRQYCRIRPSNTDNYAHECPKSDLADSETQSEAKQNNTSNFGSKHARRLVKLRHTAAGVKLTCNLYVALPLQLLPCWPGFVALSITVDLIKA